MLKIAVSITSVEKNVARILLVDDHELLRRGVRALLANLRPNWEICGEASDGEQAVGLTFALQPDLVMLDVTIPRLSGFEATARMRRLGLKMPVLIFTMHEWEHLDSEVRRAGAQGYILKSQAARDLVLAIDTLLAGGTFFGDPQKRTPAAD